MSKVTFAELPLSKDVLKSVEELGFEFATAIQGEAIPLILEGKDVVGQSRTGTGKTIAFALPAVERIDPAQEAVQALILCPTRELCIQVAEQVGRLGRYRKGLRPLPIYGGTPYDRQIQGLRRGAQIVIGTPGRLIDHLERGTLKLEKVRLVVLDEADEMLDMGFQEDLEKILETVPAERQTVMFSATMQPGIRRLAQKFLREPVTVKTNPESLAVPAIDQAYMEVRGPMKLEALARVLDFHRVKLGIVFCNTRVGVDELVQHLQARGYAAEGLHGEHKQAMRDRIMARFRSGSVEVLVATDVASRGIDVKDIELVVNYDLPKDEEDYVHRIGRTGRAGKAGLALSFASGRDLFRLRAIEKFAKAKIPRRPVPTPEQVEAAQHSVVLDKVRETLAQGGLEGYASLVDSLSEGDITASDVACALLKMALGPARDGGADAGDGRGAFPGGERGADSGEGGAAGRFSDRGPRKKDRGAARGDGEGGAGVPGKLFISIGKFQGARPKDILGALAGESGLPGNAFGDIQMFPKHTLVEVPEEHIDAVIRSFKRVRIKGIPVKARRAEF